MSGVKHTPTVRAVSTPAQQAREPLITFGDVMAGVATLAAGGTVLACKGALLAFRGAAAAVQSLQQMAPARLASIRTGDLAHDLAQAPDMTGVLEKLTVLQEVSVSAAEQEPLRARLTQLLCSGDHRGLAALGHSLAETHQERLRTTLQTLAAESFQALGFKVEPLQHTPHIVCATRPGTTQSISVDIARQSSGELQVMLDVQGFHGGTCEVTTKQWLAEMKRRGADFNDGTVQRRRAEVSRAAVNTRARQTLHSRR